LNNALLLLLLSFCRSPRTLVFCNKIETCRIVENALKRRDDSYQVGCVLACRHMIALPSCSFMLFAMAHNVAGMLALTQ
jgi:hypothetical protein